MKIRLVGAQLIHAAGRTDRGRDARTDRKDEDDNFLPQFCERV